jgi:hypothetical protein
MAAPRPKAAEAAPGGGKLLPSDAHDCIAASGCNGTSNISPDGLTAGWDGS